MVPSRLRFLAALLVLDAFVAYMRFLLWLVDGHAREHWQTIWARFIYEDMNYGRGECAHFYNPDGSLAA